MKKLIIIYILLGIAGSVFTQETQLKVKTEPTIDTSKLKGYVLYDREMQKASRNQVRVDNIHKFYYGIYEETTDFEKLQFVDWHNGRTFSYHITDNKAFNLIPECAFYYEIRHVGRPFGSISERVIARYEGVYYQVNHLNIILDKIGALDKLSEEEKLLIAIQWEYWLTDQDVEILSMDKVIDYKSLDYTYTNPDPEDSTKTIELTGRREALLKFEGQLLIAGENCTYEVQFRGDFYNLSLLSVSGTNNIRGAGRYFNWTAKEKSAKQTGWYINHQYGQPNTRIQDNKVVHYYDILPNISHTTTITLTGIQINNSPDIKVYNLTPNKVLYTQIPAQSSNGNEHVFDISSLNNATGYYSIEYQDTNNNYVDLLYNNEYVILLPQNVETREINYCHGTFNIKFYYLQQFIGNNANTYINSITNILSSEVLIKFCEENGFLSNTALFDNNDPNKTLNLILDYGIGASQPITHYHHPTADEDWTGYFVYTSNVPPDNFRSIGVRSNLTESCSSTTAFCLQTTLAHEVFHWIIRRYSTDMLDNNIAANLKWLDEGLCTWAEYYCYPTMQMQFGSNFIANCNKFIKDGVNGHSFFNNSDAGKYTVALFFHYLYEKYQGSQSIQPLKNILSAIDNNGPYDNALACRGLFNAALNNNSDNMMHGFSEALLSHSIFDYTPANNLIRFKDIKYENIYLTATVSNISEIDNNNYGSMSIYRLPIVNNSQYDIDKFIFDLLQCTSSTTNQYAECSSTGQGRFAVSHARWSNSSQVYVSNSFGGEIVQHSTTIENGAASSNNQNLFISVQNINDNMSMDNIFRLLFFEESDENDPNQISCNIIKTPNQAVYEPGDIIKFECVCAGHNINSYNWSFEGASPSQSTISNPIISYNTLGAHNYSVELSYENGVETKTGTIYVVTDNSANQEVCGLIDLDVWQPDLTLPVVNITPAEEDVVGTSVDLLEMNLMLLEKVEELTLYILQQEERITKLEEGISK